MKALIQQLLNKYEDVRFIGDELRILNVTEDDYLDTRELFKGKRIDVLFDSGTEPDSNYNNPSLIIEARWKDQQTFRQICLETINQHEDKSSIGEPTMTNTTNQVNQANTDNTMTKAIDTVKNVTEKVTDKLGHKLGTGIYAVTPNHYERVINVGALSGQLTVILYSNRKGKRDLMKHGMAKATVMSIPFGLVAATTCSLIGQTFLAAERTCRHLKTEQSKAK